MSQILKDREEVYDEFRGETWKARYNLKEKCLEHENKKYQSLSGFAKAHRESLNTTNKHISVNGWESCYVIRGGQKLRMCNKSLLAIDLTGAESS